MKELIYRSLVPFASVLARLQRQVLAVRFYRRYKRWVEWKNPRSFYDKIIWMSCYADTSLWTWLADKYRVRRFVAARCGEELLPKLYGAYDSAAEIDYDNLPARFVVKTNNGCASNLLVRNKGEMNREEVNRQIDKWLKYPYGQLTGQLHYAAIRPKIIVEEFMFQQNEPDAALVDYKFFCFDGRPYYCYALSGREFNTHRIRRMLYDMKWQAHPEWLVSCGDSAEVERPACFERMIQVATALSEGINAVRVDLYEVNGQVKFGEMTFMPGWDYPFREDFLTELGKRIDVHGLITAEEMEKSLQNRKKEPAL